LGCSFIHHLLWLEESVARWLEGKRLLRGSGLSTAIQDRALCIRLEQVTSGSLSHKGIMITSVFGLCFQIYRVTFRQYLGTQNQRPRPYRPPPPSITNATSKMRSVLVSTATSDSSIAVRLAVTRSWGGGSWARERTKVRKVPIKFGVAACRARCGYR
jgi:hypothetical protein